MVRLGRRAVAVAAALAFSGVSVATPLQAQELNQTLTNIPVTPQP